MASKDRWSTRLKQESGGVGKYWPELVRLTTQEGVVNLGQGFPDFPGAATALEGARAAIDDVKLNQYSPVAGVPALNAAVADLYKEWYGDELSPMEEVVVVTSATEALYATMQSIVNPGDEVIIFEPFFPWYLPAVRLAGGIPRVVTLKPPGFALNTADLATVFNESTKAIMLNTPHNPTGAVLTKAELAFIAELCVKFDVLCVSDEIYETCVFGDAKHLRIRDVAGMRDRTVTISGASKMLSVTGWRVGWCYGPPDIIAAVRTMHGFTTYCAPAPLQQAVAASLRAALAAKDYTFEGTAAMFEENFHSLAKALRGLGAAVCPASGGYFLIADIGHTGMTDMEYVKWLAEEKRVGCLPLGMFHNTLPDGELRRTSLVRFAICKRREHIQNAVKNLTS